MALIYKITNNINDKIYIGKTNRSISYRWGEHCRASIKLDRPLYRAMRKYGIDNFSIEEIEKVDTDVQACEREKYWIEFYNSYGDGYNATIGGDGKSYINHEEVIRLYQELQNCAEVARILEIYEETVRIILKENNIKILSSAEVNKHLGTPICQYDKNGNYLKTFSSFKEAAMEVAGQGGGAISHIKDVCIGKRKTAYGFKWKYKSEDRP